MHKHRRNYLDSSRHEGGAAWSGVETEAGREGRWGERCNYPSLASQVKVVGGTRRSEMFGPAEPATSGQGLGQGQAAGGGRGCILVRIIMTERSSERCQVAGVYFATIIMEQFTFTERVGCHMTFSISGKKSRLDPLKALRMSLE